MVLFANSDTLHDVRDQKSSNSKRELKTRISKRRAATKGFKTSVIKLTFNVCFVLFFLQFTFIYSQIFNYAKLHASSLISSSLSKL